MCMSQRGRMEGGVMLMREMLVCDMKTKNCFLNFEEEQLLAERAVMLFVHKMEVIH